jgi:hypothetical protein
MSRPLRVRGECGEQVVLVRKPYSPQFMLGLGVNIEYLLPGEGGRGSYPYIQVRRSKFSEYLMWKQEPNFKDFVIVVVKTSECWLPEERIRHLIKLHPENIWFSIYFTYRRLLTFML